VLEVAPSTYWGDQEARSDAPARAVRDEWLKGEVLRVWKNQGRGSCGTREGVGAIYNPGQSFPAQGCPLGYS